MAELESTAPHLASASTRTDLVSWGAQPDAIAGASQSSGRVLYKGPNWPEAGLWICTPGRWRLAIPRDELCYFVSGRADYGGDNGERVGIVPNTLVLFPAGWSGECTVHETMRNTYMLTAEEPLGPAASPALAVSSCETRSRRPHWSTGASYPRCLRVSPVPRESSCTRGRKVAPSVASGAARPGGGTAT